MRKFKIYCWDYKFFNKRQEFRVTAIFYGIKHSCRFNRGSHRFRNSTDEWTWCYACRKRSKEKEKGEVHAACTGVHVRRRKCNDDDVCARLAMGTILSFLVPVTMQTFNILQLWIVIQRFTLISWQLSFFNFLLFRPKKEQFSWSSSLAFFSVFSSLFNTIYAFHPFHLFTNSLDRTFRRKDEGHFYLCVILFHFE